METHRHQIWNPSSCRTLYDLSRVVHSGTTLSGIIAGISSSLFWERVPYHVPHERAESLIRHGVKDRVAKRVDHEAALTELLNNERHVGIYTFPDQIN